MLKREAFNLFHKPFVVSSSDIEGKNAKLMLSVESVGTGNWVGLEVTRFLHLWKIWTLLLGAALATCESDHVEAKEMPNFVTEHKLRRLGFVLLQEDAQSLTDKGSVNMATEESGVVEYRVINNELHLCQFIVTPQFHGSACGYHALFNAMEMLKLASRQHNFLRHTESFNLDSFTLDTSFSSAVSLQNESKFWHQSFSWMLLLQNSRFGDTGNLSCGTLDEAHLRMIIEKDDILKGKVSILVSDTFTDDTYESITENLFAKFVDETLPEIQYGRNEAELPNESSLDYGDFFCHGFLLGCSVHWISAVLGINKSFPSLSFVLLADSHNKPSIQFIKKSNDVSKIARGVSENKPKTIPNLISLRTQKRVIKRAETQHRSKTRPNRLRQKFQEKSIVKLPRHFSFGTPIGLAESILSRDEKIWIKRFKRENDEYKNHSDTQLSHLFVSGVAEYWKGRAKNPVFWNHKPLALRKEFLVLEIHAGVAFLEMIKVMSFDLGQQIWELGLMKVLNSETRPVSYALSSLQATEELVERLVKIRSKSDIRVPL